MRPEETGALGEFSGAPTTPPRKAIRPLLLTRCFPFRAYVRPGRFNTAHLLRPVSQRALSQFVEELSQGQNRVGDSIGLLRICNQRRHAPAGGIGVFGHDEEAKTIHARQVHGVSPTRWFQKRTFPIEYPSTLIHEVERHPHPKRALRQSPEVIAERASLLAFLKSNAKHEQIVSIDEQIGGQISYMLQMPRLESIGQTIACAFCHEPRSAGQRRLGGFHVQLADRMFDLKLRAFGCFGQSMGQQNNSCRGCHSLKKLPPIDSVMLIRTRL